MDNKTIPKKEKNKRQNAVIRGDTVANLIKIEDQLTMNNPVMRIV